jgi:hypothetical protein
VRPISTLAAREYNCRVAASALPVLVLVCLFSTIPAFGQPSSRRFEIGAQAALLRLSDFGTTAAGIGGRLSFDLLNWVAVEGEASYFPNDDVVLPPTAVTPQLRVAYRRTRADAFLGLKLGGRGGRIGVLAKVRPGFARLSDKGQQCMGSQCAVVLLARTVYQTEPVLDFGGILEFYPSARTVARFELGDTRIRHRSMAPPCPRSSCTSHNVSSRVTAERSDRCESADQHHQPIWCSRTAPANRYVSPSCCRKCCSRPPKRRDSVERRRISSATFTRRFRTMLSRSGRWFESGRPDHFSVGQI